MTDRNWYRPHFTSLPAVAIVVVAALSACTVDEGRSNRGGSVGKVESAVTAGPPAPPVPPVPKPFICDPYGGPPPPVRGPEPDPKVRLPASAKLPSKSKGPSGSTDVPPPVSAAMIARQNDFFVADSALMTKYGADADGYAKARVELKKSMLEGN